MAGFCRMHEKGGCPGAGQRGSNLFADVTRLAHAHDNDPSAARQQQFAGAYKICVDSLKQGFYRFQFEANGALS